MVKTRSPTKGKASTLSRSKSASPAKRTASSPTTKKAKSPSKVKKEPEYTPEQLSRAVHEVQTKQMTSKAAAQMYCVPPRTLRRHVNGEVGKKRGPPPTLTPEEEEAIVEGLLDRARKGFPAVDRSVLSKDTKPTSRYAKYEVVEDPLPINNLEGRSVRGLERDGLSLGGLRSYTLTVHEVETPLTQEEKEALARKTLIDLGPQRLLTHELSMEAEIKHENRKKEAAESILMREEERSSRNMRTALKAAERKQALATKRYNAAIARAAAAAEKERRRQDRKNGKTKQQGNLKLKCRKRTSSETETARSKRSRQEDEIASTPAVASIAYEALQLCPTCFGWHGDRQCEAEFLVSV